MAIYRLSVRPVQGSLGHSAVALSAYQSGMKLRSDNLGRAVDFSWRKDVVHSEIVGGFPGTRQDLWNAAEAREPRWDALLAREVVVAVPHELDGKEQISLVRNLALHLNETDGAIVDWSLHPPNIDAGADPRNVHAHVLFTRRVWDGSRFGDVLDAWDDMPRAGRPRGVCLGPVRLMELRLTWQEFANVYLRARGLPEISALSHAGRGRQTIPRIPLGRALVSLERQGQATMLGEVNRQIEFANRLHLALPELSPRVVLEGTPDWIEIYTAFHRRASELDRAIAALPADGLLPGAVRDELLKELDATRAAFDEIRPFVHRVVRARAKMRSKEGLSRERDLGR